MWLSSEVVVLNRTTRLSEGHMCSVALVFRYLQMGLFGRESSCGSWVFLRVFLWTSWKPADSALCPVFQGVLSFSTRALAA